jgi:very-short-patch-repair endonuclease
VNSRDIAKNSGKKYLFDCDKCNHSFEKIIDSVTGVNDSWCPYCSNNKLCDDNNCKTCFEKSFASHEKSKYWSIKNMEKPRNIFKGTHNKYLFNCEICNYEFESSLSNISKIKGTWCPHCVNKTETKLYKILLSLFPSIVRQFKEEWCKRVSYLPFDFCIPEHKIIIELDGRQHFEQVMDWKTPEEQQETDRYKEKCANDNGYSTIRLLQTDVINDAFDWLTKIQTAIQEIISDDSVIHNIYICENNEYDDFINSIE